MLGRRAADTEASITHSCWRYLDPKGAYSGPRGFLQVQELTLQGAALHFASVKGTRSHISNIAVLEALHSNWTLLLTFFLSVLSTIFLSTVLFERRKVQMRHNPLGGTHS